MNSSGLPDFDDLVNREEKNDFLKIIEDEYCYVTSCAQRAGCDTVT